MNIAVSCLLACALSGLGGCAASAPKVEVPAPPKPPTEPIAWLPADASVMGRVLLAPFRDTPLWSLWNEIQKKDQPFMAWVDIALVDEVVLGGNVDNQQAPSFVAAVRGRFAPNYLAELAARDKMLPVVRGILTVYERPEATWTQITPALLVAFSKDRSDAVVARATQGDAAPVKEGALYRSLGARIAFETSHLAVILEDASGQGREALKKETSRFGLPPLADELVRAGLAIDWGSNVALAAVAETAGAPQASELQQTLEQTLGSLSRNMFVGILGLRPVVSALKPTAEGSYVTVRGTVAEADLRALFGKLSSLLAVANTQGAPSTP